MKKATITFPHSPTGSIDRVRRNRPTKRSGPGGLALILAAAAVVAGTPIREAEAQTTGPAQIRQVLDQARTIYEEIRPLVVRIGDETLKQRLQNLRAQWVAANGHFQGDRLQMASRLAQRNLDQMRQLAAFLKRLAQRLPYYTRLAEGNRELLQMLRRRVGSGAPPEVVRQLTLASDAIQRGQDARRTGQLVQAFRLMEQAETLLRQVLRHVNQSGLTQEAVRLEIEETDRRIERLAGSENLTREARDALARAQELQIEAKQMAAAGRLQVAVARTLTARTAVRLAVRLSAGALTYDDAAAAIGHAEELMDIHKDLANNAAPQVNTLWTQARRELEQARVHLEAGRIRAALESAQLSAKLVLSAARRAGSIPPSPPPPSPEA
jgi:hypothetical protein